jgi:hypothetical protein
MEHRIFPTSDVIMSIVHNGIMKGTLPHNCLSGAQRDISSIPNHGGINFIQIVWDIYFQTGATIGELYACAVYIELYACAVDMCPYSHVTHVDYGKLVLVMAHSCI